MTLADLLWDLGAGALALSLLLALVIGCERTFHL